MHLNSRSWQYIHTYVRTMHMYCRCRKQIVSNSWTVEKCQVWTKCSRKWNESFGGYSSNGAWYTRKPNLHWIGNEHSFPQLSILFATVVAILPRDCKKVSSNIHRKWFSCNYHVCTYVCVYTDMYAHASHNTHMHAHKNWTQTTKVNIAMQQA